MKSSPQQLFRQQALQKASSPERIDEIMRIVKPPGWIALILLSVIVFLIIYWSIWGELSVEVSGQGILVSDAGIMNIAAQHSGAILDIYPHVGDSIEIGQTVILIGLNDSVEVEEYTRFPGKVIEITASPGKTVVQGEPVLLLEGLGTDLSAIVFVSPDDGKKIIKGMPVFISPSSISSDRYGFLMGNVTEVPDYPASAQYIMNLLENPVLVSLFSAQGPMIVARVELVADTSFHSGYRWSHSRGPETPITTGTLCRAKIRVDTQAPISFIIPSL